MAKVIKIVVGILIDQEQKILLTTRPDSKSFAGYWEFPGGKIEKDESLKDAIVRELQEELAIDVIECHKLFSFEYIYSDKNIALNVFLISKWNYQIMPQEGQLYSWQNITEINKLIPQLPTTEIIISKYLESLK